MTRTGVIRILNDNGACREARKWVCSRWFSSSRDMWATCPRGDWMLWIAGRVGVKRETLVLAACACARLALPYIEPGEMRPLRAIETAEAWARGEATLDQVRATNYAAAAAAEAAAYDSSAASAVAAADADPSAAYFAAAASASASAAADADPSAAYFAAAALKKMQRTCSDAVRAIISHDMIMEAIK